MLHSCGRMPSDPIGGSPAGSERLTSTPYRQLAPCSRALRSRTVRRVATLLLVTMGTSGLTWAANPCHQTGPGRSIPDGRAREPPQWCERHTESGCAMSAQVNISSARLPCMAWLLLVISTACLSPRARGGPDVPIGEVTPADAEAIVAVSAAFWSAHLRGDASRLRDVVLGESVLTQLESEWPVSAALRRGDKLTVLSMNRPAPGSDSVYAYFALTGTTRCARNPTPIQLMLVLRKAPGWKVAAVHPWGLECS
jgi:hypothetical protein